MVNNHPWFLLHPWHSPHCSKASWDLLEIDAGLAQRLTIFKRWTCLSNILLYIWTTILYPLLCQWTFRMLPWLGYCKQCCNEHWGACILSDHVFLQIKKKNEIMLFAATWMDLESVTLSAVSQTKKEKYCMEFLQLSSVAQLCPAIYNHMGCSMPGLPVHHQLLELTQTHVHWVGDAIQPSYSLSSPSSPAFNLSQHQGFSKESVIRNRWSKYCSFSFSISPSNEYSGLISFRINWLDLLAVQGTLKSLLQYHSSKASILWHSAFFIVQISHLYMTVWITINCGKFWKRWEYQTTWPASWEICMQVRKQQLELDMEQ